jgi:hypothetical protein
MQHSHVKMQQVESDVSCQAGTAAALYMLQHQVLHALALQPGWETSKTLCVCVPPENLTTGVDEPNGLSCPARQCLSTSANAYAELLSIAAGRRHLPN